MNNTTREKVWAEVEKITTLTKKKIFPNQWTAAEKVLEAFVKNHYVILKAQTQSGKTGVIMATLNYLNVEKKIAERLGIETFVYITGDNQKIKEQAKKDYYNLCFKRMNCVFAKNSDIKTYLRELTEQSKNTLIFIDESHFGTNKEYNKVQEFLQKCGIDCMKCGEELVKNNNYILSVSATPWNEIISDVEHKKNVVCLTPSQDYRGYKDFFENGQIRMCGVNFMKDEADCFNVFHNDIYPFLKRTEKERGIKKCVIARVINSKLDYNALLNDKFVIYDFSGANIDYDTINSKIIDHCVSNIVKNKYLLILVKGTMRMGKRINPKLKDYIGCVIDVSKNKCTATTEQGLLGRMCGYINERKEDEWKYTLFYISEKHGIKLENHLENHTPTPEHGVTNTCGIGAIKWIKNVEVSVKYKDLGRSRTEIMALHEESSKNNNSASKIFLDSIFLKFKSNDTNLYTCRRFVVDDRTFENAQRDKVDRIATYGKRNLYIEENIGKDVYFLHLDIRNKDYATVQIYYSKIGRIDETTYTTKIKPIKTMLTKS